eukprot:CAMPEP_0184057574 /NCGR_PEP_ID=MMETSP0956-20121227/8588_1 /TAXON_ID=627963 /ORGANISM="Aplanochytrium sp, Strain PBS07" /LENGTH=53 /DNA_ID=CAMNT_0026352085 /DNA_START=253 /DNA_END=414 /DNA_ORIENTATION=-
MSESLPPDLDIKNTASFPPHLSQFVSYVLGSVGSTAKAGSTKSSLIAVSFFSL